MKYQTKRIARGAFLIYTAVNVFTYIFAHIAYLFANDVVGEIFEYVSFYLSKSVEFLAPPIISAIAHLIYSTEGKRFAVIFTLSAASARVFYALPYYYIIFIYNYGYDSVESIFLSLLATLLVIILTVLGAFISIAAYTLVQSRIAKRSGREAVLTKAPITDFLAPSNLAVLTFALLRFVFSLIIELTDTVTFFIEYRSDYTAEEIITILVNYTLLFVLLIASYLTASAIKNRLSSDNSNNKQAIK